MMVESEITELYYTVIMTKGSGSTSELELYL